MQTSLCRHYVSRAIEEHFKQIEILLTMCSILGALGYRPPCPMFAKMLCRFESSSHRLFMMNILAGQRRQSYWLSAYWPVAGRGKTSYPGEIYKVECSVHRKTLSARNSLSSHNITSAQGKAILSGDSILKAKRSTVEPK